MSFVSRGGNRIPAPTASPLDWVREEATDSTLIAARNLYIEAIHFPAAVLVIEDGDLRILSANTAFERMLNSRQSDAAMHRLTGWVRAFLADTRERIDQPWEQPGVGGRHFHAHLSRLPALGGHQQRAMLSLVDRTAEVETARSLRAEMLHDSLTGLPNRVAFTEEIDAAIEAGGRTGGFAVLALDLSRFSRINACVGALAGDELIITVARRLMSALRAGDMLARMGGNEFGVLVRTGEGWSDALSVAERLRATLATPVRLTDLDISIDCAIGCALWSNPRHGSGDMLRHAQAALKRAKVSGRNETYEPSQIAQARRHFSIETELRRAIERDELTLAYQPLVNLATGRVASFEALARWTHNEHGALSPVEFIAVAEDCGLIVPLGRWAIDRALRTLAEWDTLAGAPLPVRMAVNVSAVQLARDDIDQAVARALASSGIGGDRLTLELTESAIVGDPDRASRVLGAIHAQGCHVAMDDFGTGYSSLAALQKLPIDILKIDRSFVTDMHANQDSVAIIRAILSLAQALGMSTTAEGVEDAQTAAILSALGCARGQGYFFARPLEAEAAFAFLRGSAAPT